MLECEVCGIQFEEWEDDFFNLCEECADNLENEVKWIRENLSKDFAK